MPDATIITDSVACLPREFVDRYQIMILPITLLVGGKVYKDGVDITPSQAYELFLKDPDSFKSSPSNPEECFSTFQKAAQKSNNILFITLSTGISTTYNVARLAQERAKTELPDKRIEILDSETAAAGQGLIALAAARSAAAGENFESVIEKAQKLKNNVHSVVMLDTVRFVYRSGRVPKIAAQAAAVLNIRPIFTLYKTINFVTATRTKKHGIQRLLSMMRDKVGNKPIRCAVMHAYDPEEAQNLKDLVIKEFSCKEIWISEFSPVMGYATGTGTLGLAFHTDD